MSDDAMSGGDPRDPSLWDVPALLSPPVCAVAAFTLSVVALLGQNLFGVGVAALLGQDFGASGRMAYYASWGLATALQVALVLLLARRALDARGGWESVLGRAAVLVSATALLAALMAVLGGVLRGGA